MGVVSRYKFNEGSGSTFTDVSGNGWNLAVGHSTNSWDASGKVGSACKGTGGRSPSSGGKFGSNVGLANWSILCWINYKVASNAYQQFWGQDNGTTGGNGDHWLECQNTGAPNYRLWYWTGGQQLPATPFNLVLGQWYHVAVVAIGQQRTLYVDGVQKDQATSGSTPSTINFNNGDWFVGSNFVDNSNATDDLIVFDHALTAEEVNTWMNAGAESSPEGNFFAMF